MTDQDGKAPTPWELMRGIERIEKSVGEIKQGVVTQAVFVVEKQGLQEQIANARAEAVAAQTSVSAVNDELDKYRAAVEDQKGKIRLMIYGIIASPLVGLLVTFIANGGLTAVR